jgi:hypothetical protein
MQSRMQNFLDEWTHLRRMIVWLRLHNLNEWRFYILIRLTVLHIVVFCFSGRSANIANVRQRPTTWQQVVNRTIPWIGWFTMPNVTLPQTMIADVHWRSIHGFLRVSNQSRYIYIFQIVLCIQIHANVTL